MGILKTTVVGLLGACCLALCGCAWLMREKPAEQTDPRFKDYPPEQKKNWLLTENRCSKCHDIDRTFESMWMMDNRRDIEAMVEDMADRKGAGITKPEQVQIADFLDYYRTNPKTAE
ncbi:MAG: hypothetical protein IT462_02370 [Planctomycetes bacterium]|nr:hypothetical protein [Planctomycetota bacterium]